MGATEVLVQAIGQMDALLAGRPGIRDQSADHSTKISRSDDEPIERGSDHETGPERVPHP
jgi:hypothetical protein